MSDAGACLGSSSLQDSDFLRSNAGQYATTEEIFKAAGAINTKSKADSSFGALGCMFALL